MFFSPFHVLCMLTVPAITALLYFIFKDRSLWVRKTVVLTVALLNTAQHILKPYIYPQYAGESLGARSTAYNMCALLILISPIIILVGSELWRNFIFYVGSIAGMGSIFAAYWLLSPMEEQIRFVICHALLFISSFLPLLFGIYRVNWRKFWKLPFVFFGCLMILIVSNIINFRLGIVGWVGDMTLEEFLLRENPCWAMAPPSDYPFITNLVKPFTPSAFLSTQGGVDTPIMWFFFPMLILFLVCGFLFGMIFDRKRMFSDLGAAKDRILKIYRKLKDKKQ